MADSESKSSRSSFFSSKKLMLILGIVLVLIVVGAGGYYVWQKSYQQSSPTQGEANVEKVVGQVGKLIELPTDEPPTLATVSDVTKLQGQPFFARAENGDQVLIYSKAKKAVLYRPKTNKIIEVGPVNLASEAGANASSSASPTTSEVKVALLNGTDTVGLTRQVEPLLLGISSRKFSVVAKENASKSDYGESVVVDLTGKNKEAATQLASFAKGKVGSLPEGETKVEGADVMIILGKSYVE